MVCLRTVLDRMARPLMAEDESGASLVEYGLLLALVAVVAIVGLRVLGIDINNLFNGIAGALGGG
jgi:pilus assembly protein Flp/PilA